MTGRVLRVFEENARVVAAGTPLLEIGDPADLEIVVEVLSRDGAILVPGTKVEFEQWGGGAPLLGQVPKIEPVVPNLMSGLVGSRPARTGDAVTARAAVETRK